LNTVRDIAKYDSGSDMTTVVNHLIYDAFGRVTAESNPAVDSLFLFTGRPFDSQTQLQNNLNRWYDPSVGRWLSEDPLGFSAGDANLYRHVRNSQTIYVDPSGLFLETLWDEANIGLGIVSVAKDLYEGQWRQAAVDAGGLAVDVAATLVPFVPGGASAGIKATRATAKAADKAVDAARAVDRVGDAARAARAATGQLHPAISTKVHKALEDHPTLSGAYRRRDPRLVTRGADKQAHYGYQRWHRELDDEVVAWLKRNRDATVEQFEAWLRWRYSQDDLRKRFPGGLPK